MKNRNKGYEIETRMKKFFRGRSICDDAVDFETSTTLYEVKSCNLFNKWKNGNDKRVHSKKPNKNIESFHLGRFFIKTENHKSLKCLADMKEKKARYIFVIVLGKQIIWKILDWNEVNIDDSKEQMSIPIKDIFGGDL